LLLSFVLFGKIYMLFYLMTELYFVNRIKKWPIVPTQHHGLSITQ